MRRSWRTRRLSAWCSTLYCVSPPPWATPVSSISSCRDGACAATSQTILLPGKSYSSRMVSVLANEHIGFQNSCTKTIFLSTACPKCYHCPTTLQIQSIHLQVCIYAIIRLNYVSAAFPYLGPRFFFRRVY